MTFCAGKQPTSLPLAGRCGVSLLNSPCVWEVIGPNVKPLGTRLFQQSGRKFPSPGSSHAVLK